VKLFSDKDPSIDESFIYVESINDNICKLGTIVYGQRFRRIKYFLLLSMAMVG
jgi:hypothetical protein